MRERSNRLGIPIAFRIPLQRFNALLRISFVLCFMIVLGMWIRICSESYLAGAGAATLGGAASAAALANAAS